MESRITLFADEARNITISAAEAQKGKEAMERFNYCTESMINTYQQLLAFTIVSTKKEQNLLSTLERLDAARDQALKLTMVFGTFDKALDYLREVEKRGNELTYRNRSAFALIPDAHMKKLIHDACLFSLPDSKWNVPLWQNIVSTHNPGNSSDLILRLLPFAGKIEAYVSNKEHLEKFIHAEVKEEYSQKFSEEFDLSLDNKDEYWISNELKNERKSIAALIDIQLDFYLKERLNLPTDAKLSPENWNILKVRKKNPSQEDLKKKSSIEDEVFQFFKNKLKNESKQEYIQRKLNAIKTHMRGIIKTKLEADLLSSKTSISRLKQYAKMVLYSKSSENLEAAERFFEWGMPESAFNHFLSIKPQDSEEYIPQVKIEGGSIHPSYKDLILEKLDPASIDAALLGKFTGCCQYLDHPQGKYPTIHGITSKTAGFYVLRNKQGMIVSQCWAWRSKNGNMVFDSIETNLDFKKNERTVTDFYMVLADQLVKEYDIPCVLIGMGGQTPAIGIAEPIVTEHPIDYFGYRDSKYQSIVALKNLPMLHIYKDQYTDSKLSSINISEKIFLDKETSEMVYDLYSKNKNLENYFKPYFFTSALSELEIDQRVSITKLWEDKIKSIDTLWEELKPLLKSINLNTADENGKRALHYSAKSQCWDIVKELLDAGAEINIRDSDGLTILHYAVKTNQFDAVQFLIKKGINLNIADNYGKTAFHYAIKNRNFEMIQFLVENGADINAKYRTEYVSDINVLSILINDQESDIYLYLINNGADVNITDSFSNSPIHYAAKSGKLHIVKKLLEKGANINSKNITGDTALHCAVEIGSLEIVRYLVEQKIDLKQKKRLYKRYTTALNIAANLGNRQIFKYLIDNGAITNELDKSIFYKALIEGFIEKIEFKNIFNPIAKQIQEILSGGVTDEEKINEIIALGEAVRENISSGNFHFDYSDKIKSMGTENFLANISMVQELLALIPAQDSKFSGKMEEKYIKNEGKEWKLDKEHADPVLIKEIDDKLSQIKDNFEKMKVSEKSIFTMRTSNSQNTTNSSNTSKNTTDDPNKNKKMQ